MTVEEKSFVVINVFYPLSMKMFHPVIEWLNNDLLALSLIFVEQCQRDVMMVVS